MKIMRRNKSSSGLSSILLLALLLAGIFLFATDSRSSELLSVYLGPLRASPATKQNVELLEPVVKPKAYAFATFLDGAEEDNREDVYFVGVRMIAYQLFHDPETKTNLDAPFIVMVASSVSQQKRERLQADGATVIEVPQIKSHWIRPAMKRWVHLMDKLSVLTFTQFDRIVMLDSDVVVARNIDDIFRDDAVMEEKPSKSIGSAMKEDEGPQPRSYVMAANSENIKEPHPYPAPRGDKLNAGVVVLKPSVEVFKHYLKVLSLENRFDSRFCEQSLFNYVHRKDGNMPWTQIHHRWTINHPTFHDYESGVCLLHAKYWNCRDLRLRDVLLKSRWKMEGYWSGMENKTMIASS